jgi:hypothetical protein
MSIVVGIDITSDGAIHVAIRSLATGGNQDVRAQKVCVALKYALYQELRREVKAGLIDTCFIGIDGNKVEQLKL